MCAKGDKVGQQRQETMWLCWEKGGGAASSQLWSFWAVARMASEREAGGEEDGQAQMGCKVQNGKWRPRYARICELLREFQSFPLPVG